MVPIYTEKGDIQDCSNDRRINLTPHTLKIWERILDKQSKRRLFCWGAAIWLYARPGNKGCGKREMECRVKSIWSVEWSRANKAGGNGNEDVEIQVCGWTKLGKIRNEAFRKRMMVAEMLIKGQEKRLKWYGHVMITPHITQLWYGHVMKRETEHIYCRVLDMYVEWVVARGRPKRRRSDCVTEDMKEKNLEGTYARDRGKWRKAVVNVDPHLNGKRQRGRRDHGNVEQLNSWITQWHTSGLAIIRTWV